MSSLYLLLAITLVGAQFFLPRPFAFLPLLVAACHLPNVPYIHLGICDFTVAKLIVLAGLLRAASTRTLRWSPSHPLDLLVAVWACLAVLSSLAHNATDHNPLVMRLSLVYDVLGVYLYARAYLGSPTDVLRLIKCLVIVVTPLATFMLIENASGRNLYRVVGAVIEQSWVREGSIRAAGPFAVAILAGTAAATSIPLIAALWRPNRQLALIGFAACLTIVICSASSGPLMTLSAGLAALAVWRWRYWLRGIRAGFIFVVIALHLVMTAPVWYLLARIDLTGGSTGYHRAALITAALKYLDEWWLAGTDYTRHWLPYGITWSANHVDITNYYIKMGVIGGLPLMLAFIAILFKAFQLLGRQMQVLRHNGDPLEYLLWCVGAALFAHSVTFISVSYFDQTYVFFYLALGAVPCLTAFEEVHLVPSLSSEQPDEKGVAQSWIEGAMRR